MDRWRRTGATSHVGAQRLPLQAQRRIVLAIVTPLGRQHSTASAGSLKSGRVNQSVSAFRIPAQTAPPERLHELDERGDVRRCIATCSTTE